MSVEKTPWDTLSKVDLKSKIKTRDKMSYLSWSDCKAELKNHYPGSVDEVHLNSEGLPYFSSPLGIFVKVSVTIEGHTETEVYPVLNGAKKALKEVEYSYKVAEYVNRQKTGKMIDKYVNAATSFDINTSLKRAYVKCVASHGLGIYVYQDEDMPELEKIDSSQIQEITNLCKKHNYQIASIAREFGGYENIASIPTARFDEFISWSTPNA